jgi:hypothetical protein
MASFDKVLYTCSVCHHVTLAAPHLVAVTCTHCGRVDLGTELARDRWRGVLETRRRMAAASVGYCAPRAPIASTRVGVVAVALAMILALVLCALAIWGAR